MGVKEVAIGLYLKEIENGGISTKEYRQLRNLQRYLLEKKKDKYFLRPMHRKKFTVAMTGGVFDVVHIGHIHTLSEAKEKADVLIAVVAQDEHIKKKNRNPLHKQEYRRVLVQALKPVDLAILGGEDIEATFKRVGPDVIVYGYDQKPFLKPRGTKVVKLKSKIEPESVKTSKILKKLGI